MPIFVINKQSQANGDHEVHNASTGCSYMPSPQNQINLGVHTGCGGAVQDAKRRFPQHKINGCFYCCRTCHTS